MLVNEHKLIEEFDTIKHRPKNHVNNLEIKTEHYYHRIILEFKRVFCLSNILVF